MSNEPSEKETELGFEPRTARPRSIALNHNCYNKCKHREESISGVHPQERKEILLGFLLVSHEGARHLDPSVSGKSSTSLSSYLGPVTKVPAPTSSEGLTLGLGPLFSGELTYKRCELTSCSGSIFP